jgi:1,4-dihydroxy-2-naphthoate octaprenyltransferase
MNPWVLAARPATLTAALAPVLVGAVAGAATAPLRAGPLLAALAGAILIQIGTNLANDVFDHEKGADGPDRLGPVRVTQAGLLSPRAVRAGMVVAFALATLAGVYLTTAAGWPVVAIGVASIAAGVAYTGGPWPLGYHGLGDVFVFIFFGPVAVCGTAFVATTHVSPLVVIASVPLGCLATAVLVVNNVRDRETDLRAGKRTLPVRFGRRFGVLEYASLVLGAYLVPVVLVFFGARSPWLLLPLVTLPVAWRLTRTVAIETRGPPLNRALAGTARLLLAFGALFALAIALR